MADKLETVKESVVGLRKILFGGCVFLWIWIMYIICAVCGFIKPDSHFGAMLDASTMLAMVVLGANVIRHGVGAWETRGRGGNDPAG